MVVINWSPPSPTHQEPSAWVRAIPSPGRDFFLSFPDRSTPAPFTNRSNHAVSCLLAKIGAAQEISVLWSVIPTPTSSPARGNTCSLCFIGRKSRSMNASSPTRSSEYAQEAPTRGRPPAGKPRPLSKGALPHSPSKSARSNHERLYASAARPHSYSPCSSLAARLGTWPPPSRPSTKRAMG